MADEQHEAMEIELIAAATFVVKLAISADRGPLPPAATGGRVRDGAGRLCGRQSLSGGALRVQRCGRCPLSFRGSSDTLNLRRRGGALGFNGRGTGLGVRLCGRIETRRRYDRLPDLRLRSRFQRVDFPALLG